MVRQCPRGQFKDMQNRGCLVGLVTRTMKTSDDVERIINEIGTEYLKENGRCRGFNLRLVEEHKSCYARMLYEAVEHLKCVPDEIKEKLKSYY